MENQSMYKYPENQCDVQNRTNLATYRKKWEEWREILQGDDEHAIWSQIPYMLWNDTVFRTVNEARKIAEEAPNPDVGFNGDVAKLFDIGFVQIQTTAIRRITEKWPTNPRNIDPNRAVYSLKRLLYEINENLGVITREVYIAFDGLPYDPEPGRQAFIARSARATQPSVVSLPTEGPKAWSTSERVHENFDKLSGKNEANRSRDDQITPGVLTALNQKLDACEDVCKFVDKFIAHAADPGNRQGLTTEQKTVSLARLTDCYKNIYHVAYYITGTLLWISSHGGLPVPQYRHLEDLDKRWVSPENLPRLEEFWRGRHKEIEGWAADPWLENLSQQSAPYTPIPGNP